MNAPSWRSLSIRPRRLSTGFTPKSHLPEWHRFGPGITRNHEETSFLSTDELSFVSETSSDGLGLSEAPSLSSQFFEHSFAVHEDLPSSQVIDFESSASASFSAASWKSSSTFDYASSIEQSLPPRPIPRASDLTALVEIPNATYLLSITPQTMTVDLIVGIISMPQPRIIKTRRGVDIDLIEMIVGDETKAGFGVNLWLPPISNVSEDLRKVAARLRPQDIILMRNVALSTFRGNVYGSSLRKDWTKLDLLYRNVVDRYDEQGAYNTRDLSDDESNDEQVRKVKRVRNWVLMFVGARIEQHGRVAVDLDDRKAKRIRLLPPDTQ